MQSSKGCVRLRDALKCEMVNDFNDDRAVLQVQNNSIVSALWAQTQAKDTRPGSCSVLKHPKPHLSRTH